MGLFDNLKAAAGVGAADVSVKIEKNAYSWNDAIRGSLKVDGGQVDQTATEVRVLIREHWVTRDSDGDRRNNYKYYADTVIAQNVTCAAGSSQQLDFQITMPPEGDLSHDWAVMGRFCVPRAADREGGRPFNLVPPPAIKGLAEALGQLAPLEIKSITNTSTFGKPTPRVSIDFKPSSALQKNLDGVKFMVEQQGERVAGVLEINPAEHSLADRMKALARKDRVQHDIDFAAAPLAAFGPAPQEVMDKLGELLKPYLI